MTGRKLRRAGAKWRLLVHEWRDGSEQTAHHIEGQRHRVPRPIGDTDAQYAEFREAVEASRRRSAQNGWATYTELLNTELDELVVGQWCHIEQMNTGYWWMNIGGVVVHVQADRDGNPRRVTVHGPGDWDDPVKGCSYELEWSAE